MDIATLRKSTGLSQSKFADHYCIPVRTLQQWEQGKSSPPPYVLSMMKKLKPSANGNYELDRFWIPERKQWKVCITDPFENCERVYPLQQSKVKELVEDITSDHDVRRIIVFGSSVTQRCRIDSDVDIYVEGPKTANLISESHDFEYDLWTNDTVDDRLMREIEETGVVVYG